MIRGLGKKGKAPKVHGIIHNHARNLKDLVFPDFLIFLISIS